MVPDIPIKYLQEETEYDRKSWKCITPPKTINRPMLSKARIYFYNQKDGAEMRALEA